MSFVNILIQKIYSFFFKKINIPPEAIEGIVIQPIRYQGLYKEESTRTKEQSLELVDAFKKADRSKQENSARNTKDPILQMGILEFGDTELISILASNNWLEDEISYLIATEEEWSDIRIRAALARKTNLSIEAQKVLASSPQIEVRKMLARWQRPINPAIAKILINDPDIEIRKIIALNIGEVIKFENILTFKSKPGEVQKLLVNDVEEVRESLALNKNLSVETQKLLAQKVIINKEWSTLKALVENESTSIDCLNLIQKELEGHKLNFYAGLIIKKIAEAVKKKSSTI